MYRTLIEPEILAAHLLHSDWVVVDCRFALNDPAAGNVAYQEDHIPGALYAHLDHDLSGPVIKGTTGRHPLPEITALEEKFSTWGISKGTQVVAYDDNIGAYASRMWWLLKWLGHDTCAVLHGGYTKWKSMGFPTTSEVMLSKKAVFEAEIQTDLVVDAAAVDYMRLAKDYLIIDSRENERYRGWVEPIDPVAGHIPGAYNAPFKENIGPDGTFLPKDQLKKRFMDLNPHADPEHTVFYCGSGVTACHNILAYTHSGLGMPKLYSGSWSEWITDPSRPIEKDR